MVKKLKRTRKIKEDTNQIAFRVVQESTNEDNLRKPSKTKSSSKTKSAEK